MAMVWQITDEEGLETVVDDLLPWLRPPRIITLEGDLGTGKTTLVKRICRSLGVIEPVTSPTYSLVNLYPGEKGMVQHLDLYRLNSVEEALGFGIEEYLAHPYLTFIEWPALIEPLLIDPHLRLQLETGVGDARKIVLLQGSEGDNDRS